MIEITYELIIRRLLLDNVNYRRLELEPVKVLLKKVLKLRLIMAIALTCWYAGTACLTVSFARSTMAEMDDVAQPAAQAISGLQKSAAAHACCQARHRSLQRTTIASRARLDNAEQAQVTLPATPAPDLMKCCPLTNGNVLVASRYDSQNDTAAAASNGSSVFFFTSFIPKPVAVPLRLPNRDQSYLLGCAFLI